MSPAAMLNHRAALALSVLTTLAACAKPTPTVDPAADAGAAVVTLTASSSVAAKEAPPATATPTPRTPKKYARVLHTGDSMVGGGLARALGPKFEADGTKYMRDVIESGTIHEFSQNDHLPKLIASFKPDLVLLTLGANHVPHSIDPDKEIGPFLPKLLKRVAGIDCYWIAPPIWKPAQAKFNAWLREHVAPCRFYDGSQLDIARRADKVHPNEKGGEIWADDLWKFMKGDGAFFDEPLPPP